MRQFHNGICIRRDLPPTHDWDAGDGTPSPSDTRIDMFRSRYAEFDCKIRSVTDGCLCTAVMGSLALVSAVDLWIFSGISIALLYLIPVGLATWAKDARAGILVSLIAVFPLLAGSGRLQTTPHSWLVAWDGFLFFGFMAITAFLLDALHRELRRTQTAYRESEADRRRADFISRHDALTGLPNRAEFHAALKRAIESACTDGTAFQVLFIDIDHFKLINDSQGHFAGDLLLKGVVRVLEAYLEPGRDMLARLSGDEFGIVCRRRPQAGQLAPDLIAAMNSPIRIEEKSIATSVSIGVASYPADGATPSQLMVCADLAMHAAKSSGRATFQFYRASLEVQAKRRNAIQRLLVNAIAENLLNLHYQPIFCRGTRQVCGVETLLRVPEAAIPLLTTEEVIAVAEETGLIWDIQAWVIRHACQQAQIWHQEQMPLHVAINISSMHLSDRRFLPFIELVLQETGFDPAYLEMEITERVFMESSEEVVRLLKKLKERGIRISVDDFGIGFSSLSYLKNFPVDALKIDKFFVKGLPLNPKDKAIADAIIGLARGLQLDVVAEGVENRQQMDFLMAAGCDRYQGYFLSIPLAAEALDEKIRSGEWGIADPALRREQIVS